MRFCKGPKNRFYLSAAGAGADLVMCLEFSYKVYHLEEEELKLLRSAVASALERLRRAKMEVPDATES